MCALADTTDIYDQAPSTVKGCECSSTCSTNILFECNADPVCSVKSKDCARGTADWSATKGHYDYCVYEPYQAYEALPAEKKKSMVMAHVNADKVSGHYPPQLEVLTGIMGESVMVSFDASADVFPLKRTKYIHSVGVTGGIRFDSTGDSKYTGLFKGAEHGIVRFSSAKQPDSSGVTPGMGVKFFRDGRPSANFVAMYSLDGQPCSDGDFFAHQWSNHIGLTDNFGLKLIAAKFWQASYCPIMVGISDLASDSSGAGQSKFPFQLQFRALVSSACSCGDYVTCLSNLEKIAVGTKLFEVHALPAPHASPELIGHVTLTDALTRSKFGDETLFFKHQHMEDDFELEPSWLDAIDRKTDCGMGCTGLKPPPISKGCSSPFNNTEMLNTDGDLVV